GYSTANPPPPINIWANREGQNAALATAIAAMLERAGLPTRLVLSSWDLFHQSLENCRAAPGKCDYQVFLAGWLMDTGDPARFLSTALGTQPATGYTGWQSADYQALLAQAAATADAPGRGDRYRRAEGMLLDQAVVIPLIYYDRLVLLKPGVGAEYPLFGLPHLRYWRLAAAP
ncbi:MAG TPA: hypothetical protein VGA61_05535, partial [Anaerolineae bacterium]